MNTKTVPPLMEQLEGRLLLSNAPLISSPVVTNVGPTDVAIYMDAITRVGEASHYAYKAQATGWVSVDMQTVYSRVDPYLQLLDSRGRQLGANDNVNRFTNNSNLGFWVAEGQEYILRASGVGKTTGTFALTISTRAVDDYGNTTNAAGSLALNSSGAGSISGTVNYAGDVDVFRLVATQSGNMRATMTAGAGSALYTVLSLLDSNGNVLTSYNQASSRTADLTYDVVAGRTYYLKAGGYTRSTGAYGLSVATTAPTPPNPVVPTPGQTITARAVSQSNGLQLLVLGTNGNDTITIAQGSGYLSMTTALGTQNFTGSFASLVMYGFAGNDVLRVTNSVTCASWTYGGDGDDAIYAAGRGADRIEGGAGNDLIVSIGGGADTVLGGDGVDSVWCDSTDTILDASSAENAAGAVHRITSFYQPYTTNPSAANYVSLEIAGQGIADPTMTSYAARYANFASRPLFVNGAQYNDIAQGAVGDCYFLASLASIAQNHAGTIEQSITALGDGTYAVRFYRNGSPVYLRIDADLPVYSSGALTYAKASPQGEIWVPLMEKAYAYFRYGKNSYASIEAGWMSTVYTEVTNVQATSVSTSGSLTSLASYISSNLAAGRPMTVGSYSSPPSPIVGGHAYRIKSIETVSGQTYVTVYNPWGIDGRSWDSNSNDGLLKITIAQFQACFSTICTSLI